MTIYIYNIEIIVQQYGHYIFIIKYFIQLISSIFRR